MDLGTTLKVGLAAGLLAGLFLGLFAALVMGPLIDEAESYEEEANPVPVLPRRVAAFGGSVVIGVLVAWGFALVFPMANLVLPSQNVLIKAWAYGLLAFAVFSLLPLLVVPATPPAVEMVPAVEERQFWYVATLISALGGVVAGFGLYYLLSSRAKTPAVRQALLAGSAGIVAVMWALPFLLKPPIFALPSPIPQSLIDTFYALTIIEWLLFWTILSTALGFLWPKWFPVDPRHKSVTLW